MVKTRQWLLAKKPNDLPELDGPNATFQLAEKELPDLKDGQVLVKTTHLSNDPAQRGWIAEDANPHRLYVPPVEEGAVMKARGLAEVVESKSSDWKKGDTVIAGTNWSEYAVLSAKELQQAKDLPNNKPKTQYLGALGLTGLTAYFGLTRVGAATADDTVVVSGAAGATGMMVVQIAKKIVGCKKVIGIAGSAEKCRWVESLGADLCLNYKDKDYREKMEEALPGPEGYANVFFDNVGGEILDHMLSRMARHGRVVACGAISNYNNAGDKLYGVRNWFEIIIMRLKIEGFIVLDFMKEFPQAIEVFTKALAEGKLQIDEGEHVVKGNFEDIPKTWMTLFSGGNTGKLITALESPSQHKL